MKKKFDNIALPRTSLASNGFYVPLRQRPKPPPVLTQRATSTSNDLIDRVESRTGAVTVVSRWIFGVAFAAPPQSGLAWSCFLFPLIEPDWQISRIRLSEKTHAFAHGRFAVRCGNWTKPYTEFRASSGKRLYPGRGSLCLSHNHRRSLLWACISTAL
jgi:hypothetical protein